MDDVLRHTNLTEYHFSELHNDLFQRKLRFLWMSFLMIIPVYVKRSKWLIFMQKIQRKELLKCMDVVNKDAWLNFTVFIMYYKWIVIKSSVYGIGLNIFSFLVYAATKT